MTNRIHTLLNLLLNPHARVTDLEKKQRSRLLSTILLVQILVILLILVLVLSVDPNDFSEPTVQGAIGMVGISMVMYIVNRLGYTSIAALGYFLPFVAIFIYIPFYSGENPAFLAFLLIPLILIAIFFSIQRTTLASIGILALVAVLLSFMDRSVEDTLYWDLRNMWFFLILATSLLFIFMWHLGNLEQIRQRELKRVNEDLELKVAELERFTYTVSHELKSPIVTMKGYLGSVDKDLQSGNYKRAQQDLFRIGTATDKMHETLLDLLELSRAGRIINQPEEIDLNKLAGEAAEMVAGRLRAHNVTVHITPDLPSVYADKKRLLELLENLMDNAAKYMGDQKSPKIEVGTRAGVEPVFFVKDNGMGIDLQYRTRIFGLFDKLDANSEGTGIGLALVKRIIETHGGKIWVESEGLRKGSTFCFTIPDGRKQGG